MKEEIELTVFLDQNGRHIVETCGRKWGCVSPAERDHVWMGAVKKSVLLRAI